MWNAVFGLIGVIVGGVITMLTEYYITKQNIRLEKIKMSKEDKLNSLYIFLVPVIEIYEKSNFEKEKMFQQGVEAQGTGLYEKYIPELKETVQKNKRYMSLELIKTFNEVLLDYDDIKANINFSAFRFQSEKEGETITDCLFDENRKFIRKVEQEAEQIEKEYG